MPSLAYTFERCRSIVRWLRNSVAAISAFVRPAATSSNAVAVRIANEQLDPLWTGTLRFGIAAAVLLVIVALTRTPLPRGAALTGSLLYGTVGIAGAFGCIHWALVRVPPASAQTILALVPLLTLLLAAGQRLERLRAASLAGAIVAVAGVLLIFGERLGAATPLPSLLAMLVAAACMAESNVIVKRFPMSHPVAHNAIAMCVGAAILLGASLVTGQRHSLPTDARTWAAVGYVSLAGSVAVFSLFLIVVQRWTASASSYVMLLMPLVTVLAASVLTGAAITPAFLAGGALVLAGVHVGTLRRYRVEASGTPVSTLHAAIQPGCA
jgi:drug/metabolite transporter (DMT)-like permease